MPLRHSKHGNSITVRSRTLDRPSLAWPIHGCLVSGWQLGATDCGSCGVRSRHYALAGCRSRCLSTIPIISSHLISSHLISSLAYHPVRAVRSEDPCARGRGLQGPVVSNRQRGPAAEVCRVRYARHLSGMPCHIATHYVSRCNVVSHAGWRHGT